LKQHLCTIWQGFLVKNTFPHIIFFHNVSSFSKANCDIGTTFGPEEIEYKPQDISDFYDPYVKFGSLQVKNWIGMIW